MVLYGDSHAAMWFQVINVIAKLSHWRLVVLAKGSCPVVGLPFQSPRSDPGPGGVFTACAHWHAFAIQRIRKIHPDLVVITQFPEGSPENGPYPASVWKVATVAAIRHLPVPADRVTVLGNIPSDPHGGPMCLSLHQTDVQACSGPELGFLAPYNTAERRAAASTGAHYIDTFPWFCSTTCSDVVGHYQPYLDRNHLTATYATVLGRVLADAINLNSYVTIATSPVSHAPASSP